ncbi:MAG: hydroxyacid dehydrogenase [Caldicoprobacterales bacterium]|jgi:phosphoglycerate dehydrogenase-like enzyme
MNILVTLSESVKKTFLTEEITRRIESMGSITWNSSILTEDDLRENIKGIDICITGWGTPRFSEKVLENADSLKLVAHTAGTVGHMVSDEFFARGIRVVSANKVFAESVAESVIGYLLTVLRDIPYYTNKMKSGGWKDPDYYNRGLLDQEIGLIGFGEIPRYLVPMLKPFRAKIKAFDKYVDAAAMAEYGVEKAAIDEIFAACPIISVHLPATEETRHMIDKKLLESLRDDAVFINTSRGSVIDEDALLEVLKKKTGVRAVLDVFQKEPLPDNSPFRKLDNAYLIPHMAGPTVDRRKYATMAVLDDIDNFMNNRPLIHEISAEKASRMTR